MKKNKRNQQQNQKRTSQTTAIVPQNKFLSAYKDGAAAVKAIDKQLFRSVPKGVQYDYLNNVNYNNVVYAKDKIPDRLLRLCERRNPVVGAITTLRIQQGIEYCHVSHNKDVPGWEVALKDEKKTMNAQQDRQKIFLEEFIKRGRIDDYMVNGVNDEPPSMRERMTMYMRDRILIDKICWEIERDRQGRAIAMWTLDGATIYPVLPGGFYGSSSMIVSGLMAGHSELSEKIRKARLESTPPTEQIAYVQELLYGMGGGGICAAFRNTDLLYDIANDLNDIRYYKQGFSLTEKANQAVVAFINSMSYNSNGLSKGAIPKVAIAMGRDSNFQQDALEDMQDEWMANFEGVDGQWNIPLLNGDAKVLNLLQSNRDMEYQAFLEFTGALTCAVMGVDPAEAGLRFSQAQQVLSENMDGKQKFSKNRGLSDLLGGFAYMVNKFLDTCGYDFANDFVFRFNGLTTEDKGFEADLRKKDVETSKTVNEVRKEMGQKPLEHGDIILNAQYIQYVLQKEQAEQMSMGQGGDGMPQMGNDFGGGAQGSEEGDGQEEEGFGGSDIDSLVDDAMSGIDSKMQKAFRLI